MSETILVLGGSRSGKSGLAACLAGESPPVTFVATAAGSGLVPTNPLARRFADVQGLANQWLVVACNMVHLSVAGLSLRLN